MYNGEKLVRGSKMIDGVQVLDATEQEQAEVNQIEQEGEETAQQEAEPAFSVQQALNKPGFAEFLAESKDADVLDVSNEAKIAEMYQAFESIPTTTKGIRDFLSSDENFRSLGIDFAKGALPQKLTEQITLMAHENPQDLAALSETISEFNNLNAVIAQTEAEIREADGSLKEIPDLQASLQDLIGTRSILENAHSTSGFFSRHLSGIKAVYEKLVHGRAVEDEEKWLAENAGEPGVAGLTRAKIENYVRENSRAREQHDAKLIVRDLYHIEINPDSIELEIHKINELIGQAEHKLNQARVVQQIREESEGTISTLTTLINNSITANKDIQQIAWKQVENQMIKLAKDPNAAFEFIDHVKSNEALQSFGGTTVENYTTHWSTVIQKNVEQTVTADIEKALNSATLGSNAYQKLETSLEAFINNARIGQKEGVDAQVFVVDTLKKIAEKNKATPEGRAKNILIQTLIRSLSANTPETTNAAPVEEAVQEDSALAEELRNITENAAPTTAKTAEATTNNTTEQPLEGSAEVLNIIKNFSDTDKADGLPRVMEIVRGYDDSAEEVMRSAAFQSICTQILDGSWYEGVNARPVADRSIRHFTQLMREFPPETYETVLHSDEYVNAVISELTEDPKTGRLREAADVFGFNGIQQFPTNVREMLAQEERFLDHAADSLLITRYTWDFDLLALRLTDIPYDFREAVFNTPRFIQIFTDFIGGSYRINRSNNDIDVGIKKLSRIVGDRVLNNSQVAAAITAAHSKQTQAKPTASTTSTKPTEASLADADFPIPVDAEFDSLEEMMAANSKAAKPAATPTTPPVTPAPKAETAAKAPRAAREPRAPRVDREGRPISRGPRVRVPLEEEFDSLEEMVDRTSGNKPSKAVNLEVVEPEPVSAESTAQKAESEPIDIEATEVVEQQPVAEQPPVAEPLAIEENSPLNAAPVEAAPAETTTEATPAQQEIPQEAESLTPEQQEIESIRTGFEQYSQTIKNFVATANENGFANVRMSTDALDKLISADTFDPAAAEAALVQIANDVRAQFINSTPESPEKVAQFETMITGLQGLYTGIVRIGESIPDDLTEKESSYADLSNTMLSTMRAIEVRIGDMSAARDALRAYLRR